MASYEYMYPGTPYSLEPSYGDFIGGYREAASNLGLTTDVRTANLIQEVSTRLNPGAKVIEISAISPEVFESVPQQHLKEVNREAKLVGAEVTVHGSLIEPSGYAEQTGWSEANREMAEKHMELVVDRSHELSPDGNVPVTFHSTVVLPEAEERMIIKGEEVPKSMIVVNPRTGEIRKLKETERFFPGEPKKFIPEKELEKLNKDSWTEAAGNINFYAMRGEEMIREVERPRKELNEEEKKEIEKLSPEFYQRYAMSRKIPEEIEKLEGPVKEHYKEKFRMLDHASIFLRDSYRGLRELYNMVYKDASGEDRKKLDEYAKQIAPLAEKGIENDPAKLKEFAGVIEKGVKVLGSIETPRIYKPLNDFILEKSSKTFGNTAYHSYEKFGEKAPIIAIENPPAGAGLSRAEDLKKLVEASRKQFVETAEKEGMSKDEAKRVAEKLIGATWDVGHINMLRKYGFGKEELLKETEKIAPFVKHVHLSDNFGFEHTELPMGMGNVPIKEIMQKLGKEGFEGKKIIEAGNWWQHFKTPPIINTFEALGTPARVGMAPYWNQIASTYGGYFAFPSAYLPEQHFSIYGSGWSNLPQELGGQIPGKQSRLSGTPTA